MNEQLSLFDDPDIKKEFADRLCKEFNSLDTVWKGTFKVTKIELCKWDHIADKDKNLTVTIKPKLNGDHLIYFSGDLESQKTLYYVDTPYFKKLLKDKDFAISITPWAIYVFYHRFEKKHIS